MKKQLRSSASTQGRRMAGARALWMANGMKPVQMGRPVIAVVNSFTQFVPGHAHLHEAGQRVKAAIERGGCFAAEFNTIAIDDGIAMGHDGMLYSLPSRDVIADSVEYMVNAHKADAMVCISNCDKITPGMLMAAMRLNIPAVFVSGGPMEAGRMGDARLDLIDAMVQAADPSLTDAEVGEVERCACPSCGCCSGMFTANSMNCLTEALGMALPGNGTIVATMDTLFSTVTGTEQNDTFETYRAEAYTLDSLRRRLHEHYLEQVHAGRMDTAVERSMFDEYTRLREREKQQAYRFIRRNSYSPAALWLLESMQSQFHEEELQSLLSGFGGRNRNVPVLMNIAQRLRNAHKIEPGNPYVDISLIEQSGREFNLSDYVGYARYTVVGFWRSDSAPSCRAMAKWSDLCRKFAYRGATFVSVSLDTDETKWREKTRELRLMGHQCLAADPADVENRYALASIPRFVLITPDGSIESRDMDIDELESRLQELLPYRVVKRDTATSSVPDSTVLVKQPSI